MADKSQNKFFEEISKEQIPKRKKHQRKRPEARTEKNGWHPVIEKVHDIRGFNYERSILKKVI